MPPQRLQEANCHSSGTPADLIEPFAVRLRGHGLSLTRARTTTLQVNVGLACNQACKHCHLEAGPHRVETMTEETARHVVSLASSVGFQVIDVTGGAPELNPYILQMMRQFSGLAPKVMLRSNLTALGEQRHDDLLELCVTKRVTIVGSLPSVNSSQVEAQRGKDALKKSLDCLRKLNNLGYGLPDSGLELNLVSNPSGAFLPVPQLQAEKKIRRDLERKWGIRFNNLHTFANVPLGRFRHWLLDTGNFQPYMERLSAAFNPCTIQGLMCRTLVSISWDGYLYDCDFNQAAQIPLGGIRTHVSEICSAPALGSTVAVSDHCYACTAGAGFT